MNPNQIPDWDWHQSRLTPDDISDLDTLDDLRRDHPIIWAIIIGHRTTRAIADNLGMPQEIVLYELGAYRRNKGWVTDEELVRGPIWQLVVEGHIRLQRGVRLRRRANRNSAIDPLGGM